MRSLLILPLLLGFSFPENAKSEINYILSGKDKNGSLNENDPTVTVNRGDTIIFNVDAFSHLFYIKTKFSRGGGDQVIKGILSGTPGTQDGKLSWNITGVSAGKYNYVCSPHAPFRMGRSIIVV